MISRRNLLTALGYLGIGNLCLGRTSLSPKAGLSKEKEYLPPHCQALSLVWDTQVKLIRSLETQYAKAQQAKRKEYITAESRWWFDAEERRWEVSRVTEPGTLDTTHSFYVYYLINGKTFASWGVNTEKKIVNLMEV
jgi:hypothetical protein